MSSRVGLRDRIKEYLLKQGFKEVGRFVFENDAPGLLAYFTKVHIDCRYLTQEHMRVLGRRSNMVGNMFGSMEVLFQGDVDTMTEFVTIMKTTKAINYNSEF